MLPWIHQHILTILIASPLLGILILALIPRRHEEASSEVAMVSSGLTLFLSLVMFSTFRPLGRFAFSESFSWLPQFGSSYRVAVDGLSAILILVVSFVILLTVLINWKSMRVGGREAFASLLAFELGLIGFFSAADILLMYVFMEISIVFLGVSALLVSGASLTLRRSEQPFPPPLTPTLSPSPSPLPLGERVGVRGRGGGEGGRARGLPKFVGFMSLASLLFLVVIVFLMLAAGSSNLVEVEKITLAKNAQVWMLALLLVGVFCRMGLFPFHSWVGEFSGQPRSVNLLLMGLVFVGGAYILYRLLPPFIVAATLLQPVLTWVAVSSIVISALISLAQKNLGSLFIYIFMAQFGFVLLGIVSVNPQGFAGSGMQMVSISASIAAISVIFALFRRRGVDLGAEDFKGLFARTPVFGLCFLVIMLALASLPGLGNFPGLFMIWMGLFKGSWVLALVSLIGVVFMATALINVAGMALYKGELSEERQRRLPLSEVVLIVPFVLLILAIGIFPDIVLRYIKQSTEAAWALFSQQI